MSGDKAEINQYDIRARVFIIFEELQV